MCEVEGQGVRGGGHRGCDVADLLEQVGADVVRDVVVHQGLRPSGRSSMPTTTGSCSYVDADALGGVLGDVAVAGDDHDDGLADVVDLVLGQAVAGARVGEGRVGDEHGKRLGGAPVRSSQV